MQFRKRDATRSVLNPTPMSREASILHKSSHATEQPPEYDDEDILREFEYHRVFVDIDVFMKHVLHVPENWRELWGRTIMRIKRDETFLISCWDYRRECEIQGAEGSRFYGPLVDIANAVLDFLTKDSLDESVKLRTPQRYPRNNPKKIYPEGPNLAWAEPLQVESLDDALDDGSWISRLKVNGRDPQENHAYPPTPPRSAACATTGLAAENRAISAPPLPPRKRPGDELFERNHKSQKLHRKSTTGGGGPQVGGKKPREPRRTETDRQKDAYLQVWRYLLDQFSVPAFRSHAAVALVDRDRIQFYHVNRSVILVSSALSFSESDLTGGLEKLIAIMIAFGRLTLRDNDILHNLHDGRLFRGNQEPPTRGVPRGAVRMQEGNRLEFGGDGETEPFTLTLGELIYREELALTGRLTKVLHAKSPRWKGIDLVVKISRPSSGWGVENEFLDKATSEAKSTTDDKWALMHLPRVLYAQHVVFGSDSTHKDVAGLFDEAEIINGEYKYERRTLRIIIQERLYPLEELMNVKDIAQVLLDVACVHRWLYERAGILHRDLSLTNIMYRITKGKVYGVLTDYDLASWTSSMTGEYTKTSEQRAGTAPFMAFELLGGTDTLHLYRHDVESLFYIMVILATHYEIRAPKKGEDGGVWMRHGKLPFERWFDQPSYEDLASFKHTFLSRPGHLDLSPTFEDLRVWLLHLEASFTSGLRMKQRHDFQREMQQYLLAETSEQAGDEVKPAAFDNETLGGYVTYSTLISPARRSTGALKNLVIRYDPPPPLPLSSTGAAQANA